MKEFTIVIQHGKARPFTLHSFDNFESCYGKLLEMINIDKVNKEYYVVNDFYKNEYVPFLHDITKYTVKVRNVSEWEVYSKEKHHIEQTSKIINLFN